MNKPTVFVTGVCGFLGRHIARAAHNQGRTVYGVDVLAPENAPPLQKYFQLSLPNSHLDSVISDLQPDLCVHCAGRASVIGSIDDPQNDFETGPALTFHLLNSLRQHAPSCRFVFLSSAAVYGNPAHLPVEETQLAAPISPYGFHKWQCELLCQEFAHVYGLRTASVRIFSAYGPGLRRQVLWDICLQVLQNQELNLRGTGNETRDFVHAHDIARAILTVAQAAPMTGEVYNVGTGFQTAIRQLAEIASTAVGVRREPVFDGRVPPGDPLRWQANIMKLSALGFAPEIGLENGVLGYAQWCKAELGITAS